MYTNDEKLLHGDELAVKVEAALQRALNRHERDWLMAYTQKGVHPSNLEVVIGWFERVSLVRASLRIVYLLKRPLTEREAERLRAWFPAGTVPVWMIEPSAEKLRQPHADLRLVKK